MVAVRHEKSRHALHTGASDRPRPVGVATDGGTDLELLAGYVTAQCAALLRRHSYVEFLTVRTLGDFCQHAAWEAKRGNLVVAEVELTALQDLAPRDEELALACRVSSAPVWSLIDWKRGDHAQAAEGLRNAIRAATRLATVFGHDYLSARRIYLAGHLARLQLSQRDAEGALDLCIALADVVEGDRTRWPFEAPESLSVPLSGLELVFLREQLAGLTRASMADASEPGRDAQA